MLEQLTAVKKANKEALADWLLRTQKVSVNTDAVFDIQSKRLHEYKRQPVSYTHLDVYKRQALGIAAEK